MSRILPIVFLLISAGLFFGYIHPTITNSIVGTNAQIKNYDAALKAAARFEQKQAELGIELQALPPDGVARLQKFLPDSVDNVQLILDLDGLAARSGIKIDNFNTSDLVTDNAVAFSDEKGTRNVSLEPVKAYDSLDLSIAASGSYAQLRAFLQGVESSLRPLDLISFQLTDSATGVYKYQMTFRLYWLR